MGEFRAAGYTPKWRAEDLDAWEGDTHSYPARVIFTATGEKGAPDVSAVFEMRDGVPDMVDFRLTAKPDGRPVRTADLRSWESLEGLALNGFRKFAHRREAGVRPDAYGPQDEREFWRIGGELGAARGGRSGPNQAELEDVARIYRAAIDDRPTETVQVQLGYSARTAQRRVQQARDAGLLPATSQGKKNA